jgi:hypothetical protein
MLGGKEWESNPPDNVGAVSTGFEDQADHQAGFPSTYYSALTAWPQQPGELVQRADRAGPS